MSKKPKIGNMSTQKKDVRKSAARKKPTSRYRSCLQTLMGISDLADGCARNIPMEEVIFGFSYYETISREDVDQILRHEELGLGVVNTYIRYSPINFISFLLNNLSTNFNEWS